MPNTATDNSTNDNEQSSTTATSTNIPRMYHEVEARLVEDEPTLPVYKATIVNHTTNNEGQDGDDDEKTKSWFKYFSSLGY